MFLMITFSLCVSFVYLIVQPFVLSKFSKILKLENLKFKSVFRINLLLVAVQLLSLVLSSTLTFNFLIPIVISISALVIQIGIVKNGFNTGIPKSIALYVLTVIAIVVCIIIPTRLFVVTPYNIPSSSMEDTLLVGDRILVNKLAYAFQPPQKGDIITLVPPHERDKHYLQRIVALENDTVEIQGKTLFVNGQAVQEDYTKYVYDQPGFRGSSPRPPFPPFRSQPQDLPTFERWQEFSDFDEKTFERYFKDYTTSLKEYRPFVVPPDYVFVMGDNRDQSYDSRGWGPVALEDIKGRAHVIYWSQGVGAVGKNEVRLYRIGTSL